MFDTFFLWFFGLAIVVPIALLATIGPERTITLLFGDADQGPVDFASLRRRWRPNDALAAPAGLTSTRIDLTPPEFDLPPHVLLERLHAALRNENKLERVFFSKDSLSERYIQRSRRMGFPDTIDVRIIPLADGRSSIALYSRSLVGLGDRGVNRRRLRRWLAALEAG